MQHCESVRDRLCSVHCYTELRCIVFTVGLLCWPQQGLGGERIQGDGRESRGEKSRKIAIARRWTEEEEEEEVKHVLQWDMCQMGELIKI